MEKKKTIVICASASHYKQALAIEQQLKKLGFKVKLPSTAYTMKKTGNYNVNAYKTWFKDHKDYKKKTMLIKRHFKKIAEGDIVLVTNFDKNNISGYIGGNVLMEMTLAFILKKPIYIYNQISEDLPIKEEVYGLQPRFLKGDVKKIR